MRASCTYRGHLSRTVLSGVWCGATFACFWESGKFDGMHGLSVLRRRRRCTHGTRKAKHRRQCTTYNVLRRCGCWVFIFEAIHVRRISGIQFVWLGWIPASSSDVLTRMPSRSRIKRNLGLLDVGITRVQSVAFRPSHSMYGVNPKAALAFHAFLALLYDGVVHKRWLKFSNSVDAMGMGTSPAPIGPKQMLFADDDRARLGPDLARTGAPGSCGAWRC
ncbi:hypothetical protein H5410_004714 [Solanum commersonii]|uniref:Uncharacterized protein n=1 Tax=Solanum commersonii TaxID=4109 RepID=A0A9J6A543_SOLCO|nr:hypothetical protein H5410_004714 [Solanum commersonii]